MSSENADATAGVPHVDWISDLPAVDGLAMLAAVTPAPNQRKKEVKSTRSKEIGHWKTKAYDACQILVQAGWMSDPGDHEGLKAHLECAKQLENNCADEVAARLQYAIACLV